METQATPRQCAERVYNDPRWASGDPCQNPAKVKEGNKWWCGTHSKAARAKRQAKQDALYEENRELDQRRVDRAHEAQRRSKHFDALVEALTGAANRLTAHAELLEHFLADPAKEWTAKDPRTKEPIVTSALGNLRLQPHALRDWARQARAALDEARLSNVSENAG